MTAGGTAMYQSVDPVTVPTRVQRAVAAAERLGFDLCVHPATGRLLQVLAAGVPPGGVIAETGTGTGAGLAWMASMAHPTVSLVSVEIDEPRAHAAQELFADMASVSVLHGDAGEVFERGPFDMMVFDGGWGSGKGPGARVEIHSVLKPNGVFTVDDFTPVTSWPPMFDGEVDVNRMYVLQRPNVLATEIAVAPDMSVVIGRYMPGIGEPAKRENP